MIFFSGRTNGVPEPVQQLLRKHFAIIEAIIVLPALLMLLLVYLQQGESLFMMLTIQLSISSFLYLAMALSKFFEGMMLQVTHLISFTGCAVLLMGILFKVQYWPGADGMLIVGAIATALGLLAMLALYTKNKDIFKPLYFQLFVLRTLLWLSIGLAALLTVEPLVSEIQ